MRKFVPNVITPEDAKALVGLLDGNWRLKKAGLKGAIQGGEGWYENPAIEKIVRAIERVITPDWSSPSYIRLEKPPESSDWHVDTGSNSTMMWCDYGCSVLLTNDEYSGFLEYRDGTKIPPEEHYCGLAIHGSDVEHRVEQGGNRVTFLAFLVDQAKDSPDPLP